MWHGRKEGGDRRLLQKPPGPETTAVHTRVEAVGMVRNGWLTKKPTESADGLDAGC